MQAIELFAPQPHTNGVSKSSSLEVLTTVFRRSLRSIDEVTDGLSEGDEVALPSDTPLQPGERVTPETAVT